LAAYSEEDTFLWLSRRDLEGETESEITAVQYQLLQTKYYVTKILKTERNSEYRLLKKLDEKIDHIISACLMLAKEQHINLHYRVCSTTL